MRSHAELGEAQRLGELDHHREPALHVARAGAEAAVALDARGAVLGAHGVEVAGERDARAAVPRVSGHDDGVAVAADGGARGQRARGALDRVAEGPLLADGRGDRRRARGASSRSSALDVAHTGTPKSRSAALRLTFRSVLAVRWPMMSAHGHAELARRGTSSGARPG